MLSSPWTVVLALELRPLLGLLALLIALDVVLAALAAWYAGRRL